MNNFSPSSTRYSAAMTPKAAKVIARHLNSSRRMPRRAGFTVLEVLIALVVLLIGGLAIMNLFPPALNVIRGSENREVAMSQVKGTLARYNSDPASIPDAIYEGNVGTIDEFVGAVTGTRNRNKSLPQKTTDTDSSLDTFKKIVGERHKVVFDGTSNFVLLNYAYATGTTQVWVEDKVEGARLTNPLIAGVPAYGVLDFSDARFASSNTSLSDVTIPTNPAAAWTGVDYRYYVSYRWQNLATEPLQGVNEEPLILSVGLNRVFQGSQSKSVVAGPVEMTVLNRQTPEIQTADDNLRGYLKVGPTLQPGQEVVVDYDVADWRWIVSDGSPSANVVRAPLSTIDATQNVYSLVNTAPNSSYGTTASTKSVWTTATAGTGINYRNGNIDYSQVLPPVTLPVAARTRLVYKTQMKWGQQASVASRSYYGFDAARIASSYPRERWREFYWQPNTETLYFHPSEAGKTIMVSFYEVGGAVPVSNQIMTIGEKIKDAPLSVTTFAPSRKIVSVDLINSLGVTPVSASAVFSVRGVSVRARAAWVQNGNYTQEIAEMYRPLN